MGIFDKAKDLAAQHSDKIRQGVEKAGDTVDQRTGGKYAQHVDKGQDAVNKALDDQEGRDRPTPPAAR